MKNWTKWYKKNLEKSRDKNDKINSEMDGLSEREKATAELLLKEYGNIEKALAKAESDLSEIKKEADKKLRANNVEKVIAENKINETILRTGNNKVNAKLSEKEILEEDYKAKEERIKESKNLTDDALTANLKEKIQNYEEEATEKIRKVDATYDKISEDNYKILKSKIDYLLKINDTGKGDAFYNVKNDLLKLVEQSKNDLTKEKYNELNDYVNSKYYIDKNSITENVTIYANDKEIAFTSKEFEWADKLKFDTYNKIGLVYGDLITINYNDEYYKAKVGAVATDYDKNIAVAIAKRKKIEIKVGTSITFNGKMYTFAGDNIWRVVAERGGVNDKDGLYALMFKFREDLYSESKEDEE